MVRHFWVITGGTVDMEWLKSLTFDSTEENLFMAADKGLLYAKEASLPVQYVLGDFDSLPENILEEYKEKKIAIKAYPPEKDYTDTHLALMWAMEEKADKISIIGGMGSRFDHSFANVGLLSLLLENGIQGEIIDPYNKIFMIDREHSGVVTIKKQKNTKEFVSLIPYTEKVTGICLDGFKYPLNQETLTIGISRGISNELQKDEGTIEIEDGILIVSISRDKDERKLDMNEIIIYN